jgi:hypothetical protein
MKKKLKLPKKINKYKSNNSINIIIGYLIKFIHYILATFIIIYILLYSKNFILNIFMLFLLIMTVYLWYIINCCIVILFENYILDEEKYDMNKRLLKNYSKIKIFDTEVIIFDYVKKSSQTYLILIFIILYLFKIIYLYNIKINY